MGGDVVHSVSTQCPTCFEWVDILIDEGDSGAMVQDCDVCCRPMEATVRWSEDGEPIVRVVSAS